MIRFVSDLEQLLLCLCSPEENKINWKYASAPKPHSRLQQSFQSFYWYAMNVNDTMIWITVSMSCTKFASTQHGKTLGWFIISQRAKVIHLKHNIVCCFYCYSKHKHMQVLFEGLSLCIVGEMAVCRFARNAGWHYFVSCAVTEGFSKIHLFWCIDSTSEGIAVWAHTITLTMTCFPCRMSGVNESGKTNIASQGSHFLFYAILWPSTSLTIVALCTVLSETNTSKQGHQKRKQSDREDNDSSDAPEITSEEECPLEDFANEVETPKSKTKHKTKSTYSFGFFCFFANEWRDLTFAVSVSKRHVSQDTNTKWRKRESGEDYLTGPRPILIALSRRLAKIQRSKVIRF